MNAAGPALGTRSEQRAFLSGWRSRRPGARWSVSVLAVLSACSSTASSTELPRPPTMMDVTMSEFRFEHASAVAAGRMIVRVDNRGNVEHQLQLLRLPDDLPTTLDAQLRSSTRRPVTTMRLMPMSPAGHHTAFAVDLSPGRYGFVCFLPGSDGQRHALKGMNSELRVQ